MSNRLEINPYGPQSRKIAIAVNVLQEGGVIIFPTETSYVFGCAISSKRGMQRIYQLKEIDRKQPLTFVCADTAQFERYTKGISTPLFRVIKSAVPGPYCFIFEASKLIPKVLLSPRATIGVKIPQAPTTQALVEAMGEPILTSSVPLPEGEDRMEGGILFEQWHKQVDAVLDVGEIFVTQSAIIDCTTRPPEVIREGSADLSWFYSS